MIGMIFGSVTKYAFMYTLGNIISLAGYTKQFSFEFMLPRTGFLFGFERQFKSMTKETRLVASSVFIGALLLTILSCFLFKSRLLIFLCLILQICAYVWYIASYVPFGRTMIKNCFKSCVWWYTIQFIQFIST